MKTIDNKPFTMYRVHGSLIPWAFAYDSDGLDAMFEDSGCLSCIEHADCYAETPADIPYKAFSNGRYVRNFNYYGNAYELGRHVNHNTTFKNF